MALVPIDCRLLPLGIVFGDNHRSPGGLPMTLAFLITSFIFVASPGTGGRSQLPLNLRATDTIGRELKLGVHLPVAVKARKEDLRCTGIFFTAAVCSVLFVAGVPNTAHADGPVIITQKAALAGNITPGDAPGFPITISRSGVYSFASDLVPNGDAISVEARLVTIDLNGFAIDGHWSGSGIKAGNSSSYGVVIKDGVLANIGLNAIDAGENWNWTIKDVDIRGFGGKGIVIGGPEARIQNVTSVFLDNFTNSAPLAVAVECAQHCHVESVLVSGLVGVSMQSGSITNSTITGFDTLRRSDNWAIFNKGSFGDIGFGNNVVVGPVNNATPMQPNACTPACP
jgi:hypothetical protein